MLYNLRNPDVIKTQRNMLKKVAVAALAVGCYVQTADAFAAGGMAPLARATPALRTTSAARPRRAGLCTVNMGEMRRVQLSKKNAKHAPMRVYACAYECACVHTSMRPCIRMHVYAHARYMHVHTPRAARPGCTAASDCGVPVHVPILPEQRSVQQQQETALPMIGALCVCVHKLHWSARIRAQTSLLS